MNDGELFDESKLAAMAKQFRIGAGKTQLEAARELRVSKPAISMAENEPQRSLFKLRKRMIERYSPFKVIGPNYRLDKK